MHLVGMWCSGSSCSTHAINSTALGPGPAPKMRQKTVEVENPLGVATLSNTNISEIDEMYDRIYSSFNGMEVLLNTNEDNAITLQSQLSASTKPTMQKAYKNSLNSVQQKLTINRKENRLIYISYANVLVNLLKYKGITHEYVTKITRLLATIVKAITRIEEAQKLNISLKNLMREANGQSGGKGRRTRKRASRRTRRRT